MSEIDDYARRIAAQRGEMRAAVRATKKGIRARVEARLSRARSDSTETEAPAE